MTAATRFAPSPTGLLHLGNARTALVAWLFARSAGGRYLLRLDDTDRERSRPEFAEAIRRDLAWLGIDWDEEIRQSDRLGRYEEAIDRLKSAGRLYPCYETAEELSLKRRSQRQRGLPPIYDRAALDLTKAERADLEAQGRRPHWRFKLEHAAIAWDDLVRGPVRFEGRDLSDPVLIREDGSPLYHVCSVADDIELGVTHVVRGEDHVANTAAHVQLFEALGARPPAFAHLALIADAAGHGLSKRLGSLGVQALRDEEGLEAMAVVSLLARLGTSDPVEPVTDPAELIAGFDFAKFARATPKLDPDDLTRINAAILHRMPFSAVEERLRAMGLDAVSADFWEAVRPNLVRLRDAADWWRVVAGPVVPLAEDPALCREAAELLPPEPWDAGTWDGPAWESWIGALKQRTGRKGKALFKPLRGALTGRHDGPELKTLLPLIGRKRAAARLAGAGAEH